MMNSKPLVSCIIIFLNTELFLEEAIESIFAQTYENWELLLVDDGSTDTSTAIALRYEEKYPEKIRYLEHERHQNCGMSATRNLGVQNAKGDHLAFLDADDVWLPETLEDQVNLLNDHPDAAMVYGPIQWWYSWTGNPEDAEKDFVDTPSIFTKHPTIQLDSLIQPPILFLFLLQGHITISGMLIRHQGIKAVGGFEDSFRGLFEDQVFCAKICLHYPIYVASQRWYKYRQHSNSCCASAENIKENHTTRLTFLDWLEKYLVSIDCKKPEVWQTIFRERWSYQHPTLYLFQSKTRKWVHLFKDKVKRVAQTVVFLKYL